MIDDSRVKARTTALTNFRRGLALLDEQPGQALDHLWAAHRRDPDRRWYAQELAKVLWSQGERDDAAAVVATYADAADTELAPFERVALAHDEALRRRAARETAEQLREARRTIVAALSDDDPNAYYLATSALDRLGDQADLHRLAARTCPDAAGRLEHLRSAHRLDPDDSGSGRELAKELWTQGLKGEAGEVVGGYADGRSGDLTEFERRALARLDLVRRRNEARRALRRKVARERLVSTLATADPRLEGRAAEGVDRALEGFWSEHRADPSSPAKARRLAMLLRSLGRSEEAAAVLAMPAPALAPDAVEARRAGQVAAHEANPTDVDIGRAVARGLSVAGDLAGARRVLARYVGSLEADQEPEEFEVALLPDLAAGLVETLETAHRRLQERGSEWRAARAIVFGFLRGGDDDEVLARLDMLATRRLEGVAAQVVEFERQITRRHEAQRAACSPELRAQIEAEIVDPAAPARPVAEFPAGSDETVMVFVGLRSRLTGVNQRLHWLLRAEGRNVIYVADPSNLYHMGGLPGVENGLDGAVGHLLERSASLGTRRLVVLGSSSGSYAAIRYGLRLGAHRILAPGPVTRIDGDMQLVDGRAARIWQRFAQVLPDGFGSLRAEIAAHPEIPLDLFYGSDYLPDVLQAEHVGDLPNVNLHVIEGFAHHQVTTPMLADGSLAAALDAAFATADR